MQNPSRRDVARLAVLAAIASLAAAMPCEAAESAVLAIKGYDPVAYFTEKRPVVGDPQYQHEWDGALYRFASAKHLELFKADPDRYLPQYQSWCTASVANGLKESGDPEYWLVVDGRLYLFGKQFGPGLMSADPPAMKRNADEHWPLVMRLPNPSPQ